MKKTHNQDSKGTPHKQGDTDQGLTPTLIEQPLTGDEGREILRICDKTIVGFASMLGRSRPFVTGNKVLGARRYMRLQYVRALIEYVEPEDFEQALAIIRGRAL